MKTRKTLPKNNKYYIRKVSGGLNGAVAGNPTIAGANVLANCVGYANGRFNESINDPELTGKVLAFHYQLVCNAENFIESAKNQGLKISKVPVQGGIMVWQKGATLGGRDGAGHVAFVEEVYEDGSILTSESGWGSRDWAFKNLRRTNNDGRWGQSSAYKFRGCIINPYIDGKPVPIPKLVIDGVGGPSTVCAMQKFFGTPEDGVISGQSKSQKSSYPALTSVSFGSGGSVCIVKLQEWCGADPDGYLGPKTVKKWQTKLGVAADGIFGKKSMKAWQKYLNSQLFKDDKQEEQKAEPKKEEPASAKTDYLVIDVSEFQKAIDWQKVKAAGIKGAIVRCGYRGYEKGTLKEDAMYLNHIQGAAKAGLKVGIYFFTEAINAKEGKEEAAYAIKLLKKAGVAISYPIAIDTEAINAKNVRANDLSKAKRTEVIKAFCEEVKNQGYEPMIYASTSWLNNKLDMSKLPYKVWCAQYYKECQYKGNVVMWQYTSEGKVNGVSGVVDMNHCYMEGAEIKPAEAPTKETVVAVAQPAAKSYSGKLPTLRLTKTTEEVIADAIKFARWITGDNRFGYGRMGGAKYKGTKEYSITHSGGCHFCGSNASKISKAKKAGLKDPEEWEYTYVCNTFVHACYAHAGVMSMLKARGHAWWIGEYQKSKHWKEIKKPKKITDCQPGDVFAWDSHFCLYLGNGKGAEATSGGGNPAASKETWAKSIRICDFSRHFKAATHIFRYVDTVDSTALIKYGEVSNRVMLLQKFLNWYGNYKLAGDGIFGDATLKAVKAFQKSAGIKVDGIVGSETIAAMKKAVK